MTKEFIKKCEAKGWNFIEPCHINIYPEDKIFGEVCDIIGISGSEPLERVSLLIVAKAEIITKDE